MRLSLAVTLLAEALSATASVSDGSTALSAPSPSVAHIADFSGGNHGGRQAKQQRQERQKMNAIAHWKKASRDLRHARQRRKRRRDERSLKEEEQQQQQRQQHDDETTSDLRLKNVMEVNDGPNVVAPSEISLQQQQQHQQQIECDPNAFVKGATTNTTGDSSKTVDVGILSCGLGWYCQSTKSSTLGGVCMKKVESNEKDDGKIECDPHQDAPSPTATTAADVGILSCGGREDWYCRESSGSPMGGFCVNQVDRAAQQLLLQRRHGRRRLDDYDYFYDTGEIFLYLEERLCNSGDYSCTTCNFDNSTFLADFDCYYEAGTTCTVLEDEYCGTGNSIELCETDRVYGSFESQNIYSLTSCYSYTLDGSPESQFNYCLGYSYSESYGNTCTVSINDVPCTSCEVATDAETQYDYVVFDCENTVFGISGNTSEDGGNFGAYFDYDIDYAFLPCEGACNICGEGRSMQYGSAVVSLPTGDAFCNVIQSAALTGSLTQEGGSDVCTSLQPFVFEECGCYGFNIPDPPPFPSVTFPPTSSPTETDEGGGFIGYLNGVCSSDSTFTCSVCEVDAEAYTANVVCDTTNLCNNVPSQCDEPVSMCEREFLNSTVTSEGTYDYTVCYDTSTENFDYKFTYCMSYEVVQGRPSSCKMSVDGIECSSCTIADDEYGCFLFDCTNTVVGYAGSSCEADLSSSTEAYFLYKLLPCENGCSLCGNGTMTMGSQSFTYNNQDLNCLDSQLSALVGPTQESFCEAASAAAAEPCGCQEDTPETSFPTSAPSGVASVLSLTFATSLAGTMLGVAAANALT